MNNKIVYGAAINLVGIWGPKNMIWDNECEQYYDSSGNFSIDKLGLNEKYGITEFSSTNKKEVELWIGGAKAAFKRINIFTR
jgi:hypothetical protein